MKGADARARIQKLLVTGDNRLKQGVDPAKVRESYEEALRVARDAGLEDSVRPLVDIRLADLARFEFDRVDRSIQTDARAKPARPESGAAERGA